MPPSAVVTSLTTTGGTSFLRLGIGQFVGDEGERRGAGEHRLHSACRAERTTRTHAGDGPQWSAVFPMLHDHVDPGSMPAASTVATKLLTGVTGAATTGWGVDGWGTAAAIGGLEELATVAAVVAATATSPRSVRPRGSLRGAGPDRPRCVVPTAWPTAPNSGRPLHFPPSDKPSATMPTTTTAAARTSPRPGRGGRRHVCDGCADGRPRQR